MMRGRSRLITASVFRLLLGVAVFLLLCPAAASAGGGSNTVVTGSFTVPLVIRNVSVSDISRNSVTITWQTNGKATSQVFYDTQSHSSLTGYGMASTENTTPTFMHTITLSGLSDEVIYHFRARSVSANNPLMDAISADSIINTLGSSITPDETVKSSDSIQVPNNPATSIATDISGKPVSLTSGNISIDNSGATPKVKIPVSLAPGSKLSYFKGSTGTTFDKNAVVIPMKSVDNKSSLYFTIEDEKGDLDTSLELETGDAIGTGQDATAEVKSIKGIASLSVKDLTPDEQVSKVPTKDRVGKVAAGISLELNILPRNASIKITTAKKPSVAANSAFQLIASDIGLKKFNIAYTMNVVKTNIANGTDIKNASITMKVGEDWVKSHGGNDAIKIFRYDPDTGEKQSLETRFAGYDENRMAIFRAISPNGLSVFSLVGSARPVDPQVISILPADQSSNISINEVISVTFDREMDKAVTQSAFRILPAINGTFSWDENTLIFTPDAGLDFDTEYLVAIAGNARDLDGNSLEAESHLTFYTRALPPAVIGISPSFDPLNTPVDSAITLYFNKAMDEKSVEKAFTVSPSTNGSFQWDGNSVTFIPGSNWDFDTAYSVAVTRGATDPEGNALASAFLLNFHTRVLSPAVMDVSPSSTTSGISVNAVIRIGFNKPMDKTSVEKAFTISPLVKGTFEWSGNIVFFSPENYMDFDTAYSVAITRDATDLAGNPLESEFNLSFITMSRPTSIPTVLFNSFADGDTDIKVASDSDLTLAFSNVMNRGSVEKAFAISPAISGRFIWEDDYTMTFVPDASFPNDDTIYTVILLDTAMDVGDNNLAETYTWAFTISEDSSPLNVPMILGMVPVLISILMLLILLSRRRRIKPEEGLVSMAEIHGTTFDTNLELIDVDMGDHSPKSSDNRDDGDFPSVS